MDDSGMVLTMPIMPSIVCPMTQNFSVESLQTSSFGAQTEGMMTQ
jgi:hypothetical protein